MKRYSYFLIAFILTLYGCQKLELEINPVLSKEQLEKDFVNVKAMLSSIYTDLPDGLHYFRGGTGAALMAAASDEVEYTYENNPVQLFNTGSWNAVNNPDPAWNNYFRAIRKVNQFLLSRDKIDLDYWKLDPDASAQALYRQNLAEISRWGYEARFLRAFFYFELIKRYGGVPLFGNYFSLDDDFSEVKRNSLQECIDFVVAECDSAAAHLPLNAYSYPYVAGTDIGRVTKLSALGLKSRALIYAASELFNNSSWAGGYAQKDLISLSGDRLIRWKAAADAAKAVIDLTGDISLDYYKNLFIWNSIGAGEILLNKRYPASNEFERINSPIGFPAGQSGNTPSQNLVDAYDVLVNGVAQKFDWNNPAMAANPYANRDKRLEMSVVFNNKNIGPVWRMTEMWQGGLDGRPVSNATKTGYYIEKYMNQTLNLLQGNTFVHTWIIMRLPEVYLNYIEALNELSPGNADIKVYYDKIRTRAEMPGLPGGLSQQEVRERIRNERRVELAFEDHRFWDVRRWMIAPTTLGVPLRAVDVRKTGNVFTYTPVFLENRVFEPRMYLYPIPQTDINIDGSLTQNPMW